jgi:hypothetical protein
MVKQIVIVRTQVEAKNLKKKTLINTFNAMTFEWHYINTVFYMNGMVILSAFKSGSIPRANRYKNSNA